MIKLVDKPAASVLDLAQVRLLARSGQARELRVDNELSLADVASAVGSTRATISRWERGLRRPRGEVALRYGALLVALGRRLEEQ
jgi:transcriptional regulator with XRE-family HTH domain